MLLDHDYYKAITGDLASSPEAFASAASSAQDLLEDALDRVGLLESAVRTESMPVSDSGYVYPTATPVTVADGWTIRDNSLLGGRTDLGEWVGLIGSDEPAYTDVTYTGGYTWATLPEYARRDLASATWALLHPPDLSSTTATPAGASSVSVDDVSISWGAGGAPGSSATVLRAVVWSPETMKLRGVPAP